MSQIVREREIGLQCSGCGRPFDTPSGRPVYCEECWSTDPAGFAAEGLHRRGEERAKA